MRLSRKNSFIVIIIIASLLLGGLIGFYFYTQNTNKAPTFMGQSTTGRNLGYNPSINTPSTSTDSDLFNNSETPVVVPKLRQITNQPVAGSAFVFVDVVATSSKNVEPPDLSLTGLTTPKKPTVKVAYSEERMRWIERGTGHIFETSTTTLTNTRLSNTTLTRIYEALFTNKGNSLVLRDLIGGTDIIRTQFASMSFDTPTSTEQVLKTTNLPVNILQLALSPDRTQIFSIMNSGTRGILSNTDGSGKTGIFDTPFKEWLVHWPNKQGIILTTKPSGEAPGYAYRLNPQTKSFTRLMGGMKGLTTLVSPDLSKILYSQSDGGSVRLFVYNTKTSTSTDLFIRTFSDKCVWSPVVKSLVYCGVPQDIGFNTYPDAWYQGSITFADSIWSINVDTGETRLFVYPPDEVGTIIDIVNPTISSGGTYMLFQNKIDLSLWGLRLKDFPKQFDTLNSTSTKRQ